VKQSFQKKWPNLYLLLALSLKSPRLAIDSLSKVNRVNRKVAKQTFLACNICEFEGRPIYMMLPSRHFTSLGTSVLGENMICPVCRSSQRNRSLVDLVIRNIQTSDLNQLKLLDLDDTWSGGGAISKLCERTRTTFNPTKPWGQLIESGAQNENLSHLTFVDEKFDMVVSSEVHEHIEDTWGAFGEVFRVLRPGGMYIFTIPYRAEHYSSIRLAHQTSSGVLWDGYMHMHGDPRSKGGIPSFWLFGSDLADRLASMGFALETLPVVPKGSPEIPVMCFIATRVHSK